MDLKEARARLVALFPGVYVSVSADCKRTADLPNLDAKGHDEGSFALYVGKAGAHDSFSRGGLNLDALVAQAELEAQARAAQTAASNAPPQDASAAAECLTQEGLTQALTAAAGPEYTAAEHERAGARLAADVAGVGDHPDALDLAFDAAAKAHEARLAADEAGVTCSLCDRPSGSCLCSL